MTGNGIDLADQGAVVGEWLDAMRIGDRREARAASASATATRRPFGLAACMLARMEGAEIAEPDHTCPDVAAAQSRLSIDRAPMRAPHNASV